MKRFVLIYNNIINNQKINKYKKITYFFKKDIIKRNFIFWLQYYLNESKLK